MPQVPADGVVVGARRDQVATDAKEAVDGQWSELSERVIFESAEPNCVVDHDRGCEDQANKVQAVVPRGKRPPDRPVPHPVYMFGRVRNIDDGKPRVRFRHECAAHDESPTCGAESRSCGSAWRIDLPRMRRRFTVVDSAVARE